MRDEVKKLLKEESICDTQSAKSSSVGGKHVMVQPTSIVYKIVEPCGRKCCVASSMDSGSEVASSCDMDCDDQSILVHVDDLRKLFKEMREVEHNSMKLMAPDCYGEISTFTNREAFINFMQD